MRGNGGEKKAFKQTGVGSAVPQTREKHMESTSREDLQSILPYLPVVLRSSSLFWPSQVVEALKAMARGPEHSRVHSGELLSHAISHLKHALTLSTDPLAPSALEGYALFFDQVNNSFTTTNFVTLSSRKHPSILFMYSLYLSHSYDNDTK